MLVSSYTVVILEVIEIIIAESLLNTRTNAETSILRSEPN